MAQFGPESVAHFAPEWVAYFGSEWVAQFGPEYANLGIPTKKPRSQRRGNDCGTMLFKRQTVPCSNVFYPSVRLCVHSSNKARTTKKTSAVSFAPVNPLRKRCWPRVSRKRETGKAQDIPNARSLFSLETQKTQSKKQQKVGMISHSLRHLRLCVRQILLLSQRCPTSSVSTNDKIN